RARSGPRESACQNRRPLESFGAMSSTAPKLSKGRRFWQADSLGPLLALILLVAVGTILDHIVNDKDSRKFLSLPNFLNILRQNSFVGIVALGMTFVIILGGIDLAVGSVVALSGGLA